MPVKLSDREISALAKKMAAKYNAASNQKATEEAKKYLPEAKKLLTTLGGIQPAILKLLYNHSYNYQKVSALDIAKILSGPVDNYGSPLIDLKKDSEYEADVVLAAHECTTMQALCKKLDI